MKKIILTLIFVFFVSAVGAGEKSFSDSGKKDRIESKVQRPWYEINWEAFRYWKPIRWFFPIEPVKPQPPTEPAYVPPPEKWMKVKLYDPCAEGTITCPSREESGSAP